MLSSPNPSAKKSCTTSNANFQLANHALGSPTESWRYLLHSLAKMKIYYERNLPHWHPPGATFFLTYRLAGSIPLAVLRQMKEESDEEIKLAEKTLQGADLEARRYEIQRRFFGQYDAALDTNPNGPYWLRESAVAELVIESLRFCAEKYFHLWAFCIMPNHVHVLLKHHADALLMRARFYKVTKVLQGKKRINCWGEPANFGTGKRMIMSCATKMNLTGLRGISSTTRSKQNWWKSGRIGPTPTRIPTCGSNANF